MRLIVIFVLGLNLYQEATRGYSVIGCYIRGFHGIEGQCTP